MWLDVSPTLKLSMPSPAPTAEAGTRLSPSASLWKNHVSPVAVPLYAMPMPTMRSPTCHEPLNRLAGPSPV